MNLFDKAYQHLGYPPATYTTTTLDESSLATGVTRCISTLVYEDMNFLTGEDFTDDFSKALEMVNHDLNKSISGATGLGTKTGNTVIVTIVVYR